MARCGKAEIWAVDRSIKAHRLAPQFLPSFVCLPLRGTADNSFSHHPVCGETLLSANCLWTFILRFSSGSSLRGPDVEAEFCRGMQALAWWL